MSQSASPPVASQRPESTTTLGAPPPNKSGNQMPVDDYGAERGGGGLVAELVKVNVAAGVERATLWSKFVRTRCGSSGVGASTGEGSAARSAARAESRFAAPALAPCSCGRRGVGARPAQPSADRLWIDSEVRIVCGSTLDRWRKRAKFDTAQRSAKRPRAQPEVLMSFPQPRPPHTAANRSRRLVEEARQKLQGRETPERKPNDRLRARNGAAVRPRPLAQAMSARQVTSMANARNPRCSGEAPTVPSSDYRGRGWPETTAPKAT